MRIGLVFAVVILAGCSREDGERLGRVGRLAGEKVRDAAPAHTPLGEWKAESTPAGRVRTRFQTDALLTDQPILVTDATDGIHLGGRVATQAQAEWAVKLAQQTVGVSIVVNELAIGP